jgi:hypothetical protein
MIKFSSLSVCLKVSCTVSTVLRRTVFCLPLLLITACVPGSSVDRELQRVLGVRSPEEQLYCHTIQQTYLAKPVPEIPPSCDQILQRAKDEQAGKAP